MLCSDNQSKTYQLFASYARQFCQLNDSRDVIGDFQLSRCDVAMETDRDVIDDDDDDGSAIYRYVESVIYNRVIVTICLFGVVGNVLNLVVLSCLLWKKTMSRMERSVTISLLALAVSDLLFCLAVAPYAVTDIDRAVLHDSVRFPLVFGTYQEAVISTLITSSAFLTVLMAVSRYLAICHPLKARSIVSVRFAVLSIALVFVASVLLNLPRFWYRSIDCVQVSESVTVYLAVPGYIRRHRALGQAYFVSYVCVGTLAPLVVLAYCNYFLVRALRISARMRREFARENGGGGGDGEQRGRRGGGGKQNGTRVITLTLAVIVVLYGVLVSPAEISNIFTHLVRSDGADSPAYNVAVAVANALQTINFSFNFVLYCVVNVGFRRVVCHLVTCRAYRKRKWTLGSPDAAASRSSAHTRLVVIWNQGDSRKSAVGNSFTTTTTSVLRRE